jgi:hypothetical protein
MDTHVKSPLSRKAVLLSVNISQWTARRLDRRVTDETNEKYHAAKDAGRYNKLLIEKERTAKITNLVSAARALHYKYTKPWLDDGPRILPNAVYVEFSNEFRKLKEEFEVEVDKFCREYPSFIEERKAKLNGLFNQADYPDASDIRSKFNLEMSIDALPDAADFRSDLDPEIADDIKREIEAKSVKVSSDTLKHTVDQIVKVVGHMAKRLTEYQSDPEKKSRYSDSWVDNVRELGALLPAFNLTGDAKLAAITDRIQKELCIEDAQSLKDNHKAREVVAKSAEDIVADVTKFFG